MAIASNLGAGISGSASKSAGENIKNVLFGKQEHYADILEEAEPGMKGTLKAWGQSTLDHVIGKDYAGEGMKRAGVIAARAGVDAGTSVALMGTINHATGNGGFFKDKNGQRDIAGIPFI